MINGNVIKSANRHILAEARERVHLDRAVRVIKIETNDQMANDTDKARKRNSMTKEVHHRTDVFKMSAHQSGGHVGRHFIDLNSLYVYWCSAHF